MLLQHAVRFYEARDWIHLQDQNQLTYASLLQHCKTLEQRCEQYQKAQIKGRAELTTLSAETATASSVHQDNITLHNTNVPDVDTSTLVIIVQQKAKNATTAMD